MEEYLAINPPLNFAAIVINPNASINTRDKDIETLCQHLAQKHLYIAGELFYATHDKYPLVDREMIYNQNDWFTIYARFSMNEIGQAERLVWEDRTN